MVQDLKSCESLEAKVDEHSLQIQELHDEIDFKKWKIDSLIEKIDNLTSVVQQIQLNQLRDDNDIRNRVTAVESGLSVLEKNVRDIDVTDDVTGVKSTLGTLEKVVGVGLTVVGLAIAGLALVCGV